MRISPTTFIRLPDGSWGVIGHASRVVPGRGERVVRRDGTSTTVEIVEVVESDGHTVTATIA